MKKLALFLSVLILGSFTLSAFAEQGEKKESPKNEVLEAAREFMENLDKTSQRHFSVLHGNYNLIKVVETVRESVDEAVEGCAKANPEMKDALDGRFSEWKDAIKPVMEEADANVKNMILAQDYAEPQKIREFLKMIDKARKNQDEDVKKVPVVTPEACQNLLDKMDETQVNMVRLLQATLVSLPQAMQTQDEERRATVKAEEEEQPEAQAKEEEAQDHTKSEAKEKAEEQDEQAEEKGGE